MEGIGFGFGFGVGFASTGDTLLDRLTGDALLERLVGTSSPPLLALISAWIWSIVLRSRVDRSGQSFRIPSTEACFFILSFMLIVGFVGATYRAIL